MGQIDPTVHDILFVDGSTVIAVTGGENQSHSQSGNIYRSSDGGASWTQVTPASGFSNGNAITMHQGSTNTIYVGAGLEQGTHPNDKGALWKSTDDGLTWTKVNSGPSNRAGTASDLPILDLVVGSKSADTLYAAAGSNLDHAFAYSHDGGTTFTTTKISGEGAFSSVMMNKTHEDTLCVAIRRELYMYDAKNDSSILVFLGLPGELIPDLVWGSVLMGSTTGAYKIDVNFKDIVTHTENHFSLDQNKVTLFPNPSNGMLSLSVKDDFIGLNNITIYTLLGNIVYSKNYNQHLLPGQVMEMNLSHLRKGTYQLVITGQEKQTSAKIVLIK